MEIPPTSAARNSKALGTIGLQNPESVVSALVGASRDTTMKDMESEEVKRNRDNLEARFSIETTPMATKKGKRRPEARNRGNNNPAKLIAKINGGNGEQLGTPAMNANREPF